MKTRLFVSTLFFISALFVSSNAVAAPLRPFDCLDSFRSAKSVAAAEAFRQELSHDPTQIATRREVIQTLEAAFTESFVDSNVTPELQNLIRDVGILVDNRIFDEALARALRLADVKDLQAVENFKLKLREASKENQLEFAQMVIRQYGELFDKAFNWVDEDQFLMLEKRWGITPGEAYKFLNRWSALSATNSSELALGVLAWAKAIDANQITQEIRAVRKKMSIALKDSEEILITRIKTPHSIQDLALNKGPITEAEFARKMRFWNAWGWTKHKLNIVRYPKGWILISALSIIPSVIVHPFAHDWGLTGTVATISSSMAGCAILVAKLTPAVARKNHDATWLEVLTLKQLSEFKQWIAAHPARALELGFAKLGPPATARIEQLRKIRYAQLGE